MKEGKRDAVEKAEGLMLRDLMNLIRDQAIALPKPWSAMSQDEQQDYLDSAESQIRASVDECVNFIACQDVDSAVGLLKKVTFEKGCVANIVFSTATQDVLNLAALTNSLVKVVVIPGLEEIVDDSNLPEGEADQRSLGLGQEHDQSEDAVTFED